MSDLARRLATAIGDRRLIWFGIRGEDGEPLSTLPQLSACYSITAPARPDGPRSVALESITGIRVDLDRYEVDDDRSDSLLEIRAMLMDDLAQPAIIVPYRPSRFVSALCFANLETAQNAGMFKEQHLPFEHKPWVETNLRTSGIDVVPWRYVADERHADLLRHLHDGPLIVRPNRGSGGVGLARVESADELRANWPKQVESFASVAPFLDNAVPLNIAACVFPDGSTTMHPLSVQLIGLPSCVDRSFGYCGNDFSAARGLPHEILDSIEDAVRRIGSWLHEMRYIGAFGVDFLLVDGMPLFSEVNPRFQGSSALQAEVSRRLDLPDLYLDHLAAHLRVDPGERPPLREMTAAQPSWSHLVVHWQGPAPIVPCGQLIDGNEPDDLLDLTLIPPEGTAIEHGGVLFRLVLDGTVTSSGFDLDPATQRLVDTRREAFLSERAA